MSCRRHPHTLNCSFMFHIITIHPKAFSINYLLHSEIFLVFFFISFFESLFVLLFQFSLARPLFIFLLLQQATFVLSISFFGSDIGNVFIASINCTIPIDTHPSISILVQCWIIEKKSIPILCIFRSIQRLSQSLFSSHTHTVWNEIFVC